MSWDDDKAANDLIKSDDWDAMVSDQKGHAARHESGGSDALTFANLASVGITEIDADTAANRPAAGTSGRIFFETDTGRTLYDNGSSWIEVGLSESEISLANLSSRSHSDLSDAPSSAHHSRPVAGTHLSEDGSDNFNVDETGIEVDNLAGNNGSTGQFLKTDGSVLSFADVSTVAFEPVADRSSIPSSRSQGEAFVTQDKKELLVEVEGTS